MTNKTAFCNLYESCSDLQLTGLCCPTASGIYLGCCNLIYSKSEKYISDNSNNYLYLSYFINFYNDVYISAENIDDTSALKKKFIVMGLLAVLFTFIRSIINFVKWNPLNLDINYNFKNICKIVIVIFQIFIMSGAILFAGMAGECFSIPMDLLTSLFNDGLSYLLRMPHHSFLSEYMINLTISGLHVWNCLRLLAPRFNKLSGTIIINLLSKYITLNPDDINILKSSLAAHEIFDLKQMTIENPLCIPTRKFIKNYCILFSKMFVFSVLARIMAFSMLWVTTLVPLIMEPLFGLNSFIYGITFMYFGQHGAASLAVLWSVIMGIVLGEKQSSSGGKESKEEIEEIPNNKISLIYYRVYDILFKNLENRIYHEEITKTYHTLP